MNSLPPRIPPVGPLRALYNWLNQLRDCVAANMPKGSANVRVTRSSRGTTISANPGAQPTEEGEGVTSKSYWA